MATLDAAASTAADPLTGSFGTSAFEAIEPGFVIGRSDELGTTTLYLFDHAIDCDQISSYAWLAKLPSEVQVIEIIFPTNADTTTPVSSSLVSYAHGGMYSFNKKVASSRTLTLSQYTPRGSVAGRLTAVFDSGSVMGSFRADYCASGGTF